MNNNEDDPFIELIEKLFELEGLNRLYRQGYEGLPEEPELGEAQVALAGEILPKESW